MRVYTDRAALPDGTYIASSKGAYTYCWFIKVDNPLFRVLYYIENNYIHRESASTDSEFSVKDFLGGEENVEFVSTTLDEFIENHFEKLI